MIAARLPAGSYPYSTSGTSGSATPGSDSSAPASASINRAMRFLSMTTRMRYPPECAIQAGWPAGV
jgi:hypothetical protein